MSLKPSAWVMGMLAALALVAGCAAQPDQDSTSSDGPTGTSGQSAPTQDNPSPSAQSGQPDVTTALVSCAYEAAREPARPVDPPPSEEVPATGTMEVTLQMSEGPVRITLDRAAAPCTVNSFLGLAKQGFFDDTRCHRLVDQGIYILQCGDPTGTGRGGPGYQFADELTGAEQYSKGVVAMANAGPNTNGSQFFFVWADSKLSPDYTVFGAVDEESLEVITTIAAKGVSRDQNPAPISQAKIEQVILG